MKYDGIVFDLDGTLLDTLDDIAASANAVLHEMQCAPHSRESYREYVGFGLRNMALQALPTNRRTEADVEAFVAGYRAIYAERWKETSRPFDGIPELLDVLVERRMPMAVLSNKRNDFTERCVHTLLGRWPFKVVRGEVAGVPLKPDPTSALAVAADLGLEPRRCLFVGDSEVDIKTAQRAGMSSAGVLWGYRDREVLERCGPSVLVAHPAELLAHCIGSAS
jgi:phosphoglycolate phosphatase